MIRKLAVTLAIAAGLGQSQTAFEVASIKPNHSGERFPSMGPTTGGKFTAKNVTVMGLLRTAYRLDEFRITGLPAWANSERFDIAAKAADGNATVDQIRVMIQALLADRFQMALHRENRELPLYVLTVVKGGPKLHKAKTDVCVDQGTTTDPCGGFRIYKRSQMWGNTVTVAQLAAELTYMMERMVVDKTGIQRRSGCKCEWYYSPQLSTPWLKRGRLCGPRFSPGRTRGSRRSWRRGPRAYRGWEAHNHAAALQLARPAAVYF